MKKLSCNLDFSLVFSCRHLQIVEKPNFSQVSVTWLECSICKRFSIPQDYAMFDTPPPPLHLLLPPSPIKDKIAISKNKNLCCPMHSKLSSRYFKEFCKISFFLSLWYILLRIRLLIWNFSCISLAWIFIFHRP